MLTIARNIICWLLHSNCSWYSLLDLFQSFPSTLSLSLALMVPTWSGNKVLQPHRNAMQWPKQQEVNQWGNRGRGTLKTNRVQMLQQHQGGQGTVQGLYEWLWCVACNSACPPVHKSAPGLELPHHPQNQDCSKQQGNQDSQNRLSKSLSKGMDISGGIHVIYGGMLSLLVPANTTNKSSVCISWEASRYACTAKHTTHFLHPATTLWREDCCNVQWRNKMPWLSLAFFLMRTSEAVMSQ